MSLERPGASMWRWKAWMKVSDRDTESHSLRAGYFLPPSSRSFFTADLFADGVLLPKGGGGPEDTAVQDLSWARTKALGRVLR